MGYTNVQADVNFYRQSLNADGVKYVTGPYTSLYEDVFRAVTVTTDSVVSVTSYVGDSLSNQFLLAGTEIYGLFSSVTIHSGKAVLHLAGASYISEIINQYSASGIPLGFYEEGTQCLTDKINRLLTQGLFDDASWVMVPSQYEEDWVRAFKPTSELGNLAFTRSSDATFTDSTGVVRRSPWNLLERSEEFDNAYWTKGNASVSANAAVAPNGTLTADKLIPSAGSTLGSAGNGVVARTVNILTSRTYSYSIFAKSAEFNSIRFRIVDNASFLNLNATFNLSSGTVASSPSANASWSSVSASINAFGDYYRVVITGTYLGTAAVTVEAFATDSVATTGNGTSGVYIWGAQLVEGTEALSYFATTDRLNVPRLDYRNADGTLSTCPRLLLEPQRTNSIRNSSMVGAVAGSPGTLPTNWGDSTRGLTRSVVGIGVVNGLPYIDLRYNGTATGVQDVAFDGLAAPIVAALGQSWSLSCYVSLQSGTIPITSLRQVERNAAGSYLTDGTQAISITSNLQRFTYTRTTTNASVERISPFITISTANATAYDFTIRVAAPQMELGAYATTWVPTTTTAVTRIADFASKTGVSSLIGQTEGTWFCEIDLSKLLGTTARDFFVIGDGRIPASASSVYCSFSGIGSNLLRARVMQSGVVKYDQRHTITATGTYKIALAYKSQNCAMYVNGSFAGTVAQNDAFSFSLNQIFTSFDSSSFQFADGIAQAALFPVRLDNATLAALTTL